MTGKALTKAEKAYVRIETRLAIVGAIVRLFEELEKEKKINQTVLADRLGVSRSRASKLVTAPGNWTLDTVADLLAAMDAKLTNVEVKLRAQTRTRHDWQIPKVERRTASLPLYYIDLPSSSSSLQPKISELEIAS